mgnify:CR=1 FL=1
MNKHEIYTRGFNHGQSLVNENINSFDSDDMESWEDFREVIMQLIWEADDCSRQYSPFEFLAKELNDSDDPDGDWELYESGISNGALQQSMLFFGQRCPDLEQPNPNMWLNTDGVYSDADIMDYLHEQFGEDAANAFGDCLDHFRNMGTEQEIMDTANNTLSTIGTQIRVVEIADTTDDGYVWKLNKLLNELGNF